ncbi:hypothetical protein DIPPA_11271 [Diplonema papillatum]|nr:hypothetical protein DIPPA_11271 [Diplonema papillatum]
MDFTWPMSGAHDAQDREAGAQKDESTAVDFVVNAWSLLRGLGTERTTVAAASLAAAGEEPSGERNVDFVKQTWALYQQAMDEGWVTEWVEKFCSPDIFLTDGVGRSTPYVVHGHEELCEYYNVVLEKVWDHGKATVTWVPRGFYSMGSIVIAEYDIEVTPKGSSHTRQLWLYHVEGDKLKEIRMYPLNGKSNGMPPPVRPSKKPADKRVRTEAEEMNDAVSCVSMPSLAESIPQNRPGGVALSRPCCHNAWDNVRIKRGWAILRCRICQCQWRLRPTAIPHCTDFARGAGACPRGVECPQLHVHRTREQSSDKKMPGTVTGTPNLAPNVGSAPPPFYAQHQDHYNNYAFPPYSGMPYMPYQSQPYYDFHQAYPNPSAARTHQPYDDLEDDGNEPGHEQQFPPQNRHYPYAEPAGPMNAPAAAPPAYPDKDAPRQHEPPSPHTQPAATAPVS